MNRENVAPVNRLKFGQLTFEIRKGRNIKFQVFRNERPELPHLLISFGNPTKEIDIHLTHRTAGGKVEYHSIGKVPESAIGQLFESIEPKIRETVLQHASNLRRVRPGWLTRHGYIVCYLNAEVESKVIDFLAPKRKHHSKLERVLREAGLEEYLNTELARETVFLPSVLHELKRLNYAHPIMIARVRGKLRPRLGGVCLFRTNKGNLQWVAIHELTKKLMPLGQLVIDQLRKLVPEDKWQVLLEGLGLDEVDWIASS